MEARRTEGLVMIGDATYDLEMAQAAGVKAIGVTRRHHSAQRLREWAPVVDSVDELGRILGV
ncbi:MAG: HAD hydrolase-like protein [Myxococcota bacterium]|nr:HAD hydrolase-like protein [Myxococcota bacterium]